MSHNPCESRHERIAALAIGELAPPQAAELLGHLETCPECQGLYEEMVQGELFVQATFAKMTKAIPPPQTDLPRIDLAVPRDRPVAGAAHRSPVQRRRWTPLRTLTLAAVFVLAASGLFSRLYLIHSSFGMTFADVLQRIQKAQSVTYKQKVQVDGQEPRDMQYMAMWPARIRTAMPNGELYIQDFAKGKEAYIDSVRKVAQLTHMVRHDRQRLGHYLEWVTTVHDTDGVFAGQHDVDGRMTNVFRISQPFEQITVWADLQTDLPVRIERVLSPCLDKDIKVPDLSLFLTDFQSPGSPAVSLPETSPAIEGAYRIYVKAPGVREKKTTITMTDFTWDVALDESLFEVIAPAGYLATAVDFGDPPVGDESLIASLRFWAETSDGTFPADINMLLEAGPKLIKKFDGDGPAEQEYAEALKMAYVVANGMLFAQELKTMDNWHYAGKDVKAGEADKPLCWWKDKRAATYRVVYGDLTVRDVLLTQMPQIEGP